MVLITLAMGVGTLFGQFHEDFESATPTWKRRESDCTISDSNWDQRRSNELPSRNRFEKIFFQNGQGTEILVSHDVPPAFVISELTPAVRIKASRSGVHLLARVVLPHTPSPSGEGPMTTMLSGPRYRSRGKWESLSFSDNNPDMQQQLKEKIWLLRRKYGAHVNQRDAYVDKIVLNLYVGPGQTTVQIDDLKLNGIVSANAVSKRLSNQANVRRDSNVRPTGFNQEAENHKSLVIRDGTVLLVKKRPFFPKIIQHNGEPFDYLKALGFNTIELGSVATEAQLRQAQELDIWLVCPPPSSVGLSPIGFQFDRVLVWKLGERLEAGDIPRIQQRVREIRASDRREGRPVMGNIASNWMQISRSLDVISIGLKPVGSSFIASQYSDWILERSNVVGNSKPIWADIQTELSQALVSQIGTLAKTTPPIPLEPQQIKFLAFEAISGGARGLRFLSRTRLDGADPVTRLRAQTVEWANALIDQIEPWAVGGALMGEVATRDEQLEVTAISTNRSRLLLIQRPTHHEQYVSGDVGQQTVVFQDANANSAGTAYYLGDTGLVPLPNTRTVAGAQIQIDKCPFAAAVVLTQDPMVVKNLTQSYERVGRSTILQLHRELTRQWLAIMQLLDNQMGRMGRSSARGSSLLNEAVNAFRTAEGLIEGSSPQSAVDYLNQTDERLAFLRREMITEPLGKFQSKTSTPFAVHCSLIPLHWELAGRLSTVDWNPNGLAGGDFENLQHMMSNGWENRRLNNEFVSTKVELSDAAAVDGAYGLRMSVSESSPATGLLEATPLWIATPELPVKGGQLVRIHGWVNVPQVIRGSHDGLTITDSLGGVNMMERIPVTSGWQEFSLYRGVPKNGTVKVTFSLNGVGVAMLDEVTVRTIDLPPPAARQARQSR